MPCELEGLEECAACAAHTRLPDVGGDPEELYCSYMYTYKICDPWDRCFRYPKFSLMLRVVLHFDCPK